MSDIGSHASYATKPKRTFAAQWQRGTSETREELSLACCSRRRTSAVRAATEARPVANSTRTEELALLSPQSPTPGIRLGESLRMPVSEIWTFLLCMVQPVFGLFVSDLSKDVRLFARNLSGKVDDGGGISGRYDDGAG